jgi:hypothetical protein
LSYSTTTLIGYLKEPLNPLKTLVIGIWENTTPMSRYLGVHKPHISFLNMSLTSYWQGDCLSNCGGRDNFLFGYKFQETLAQVPNQGGKIHITECSTCPKRSYNFERNYVYAQESLEDMIQEGL